MIYTKSQETFYDGKREKKPVHKVQMTEGKRQIIRQLLQDLGNKNIPTFNTEVPKFGVWFENVYKKQYDPKHRSGS